MLRLPMTWIGLLPIRAMIDMVPSLHGLELPSARIPGPFLYGTLAFASVSPHTVTFEPLTTRIALPAQVLSLRTISPPTPSGTKRFCRIEAQSSHVPASTPTVSPSRP
jgi:hypothetical protein